MCAGTTAPGNIELSRRGRRNRADIVVAAIAIAITATDVVVVTAATAATIVVVIDAVAAVVVATVAGAAELYIIYSVTHRTTDRRVFPAIALDTRSSITSVTSTPQQSSTTGSCTAVAA